jgi:hypothetical protein
LLRRAPSLAMNSGFESRPANSPLPEAPAQRGLFQPISNRLASLCHQLGKLVLDLSATAQRGQLIPTEGKAPDGATDRGADPCCRRHRRIPVVFLEGRSVVRVPAASTAVILLVAGRARAARGRWDHRNRGGRGGGWLRFDARWRGSGRFRGRWFGGHPCRRRFVPRALMAIRLGRCPRRQGIAGGDRFGGEADLLACQAAGGDRHARGDQQAEQRQRDPANRRGHPHAGLSSRSSK